MNYGKRSIVLFAETCKCGGAAYQLIGKIIYKQLEGITSFSASVLVLIRRAQKSDQPLGSTGESKTLAGRFTPSRSLQNQKFLFWDHYLVKHKTHTILIPQNKFIKRAVSKAMRQSYICCIHNIFPRSV